MIGREEREAAVLRLQEAYAAGHVPHEEMDGLLHRVLSATTRGELTAALAALPDEGAATITAVGGRIVRRGAWRVPRTLTVASALGRVRLDLSRATIDHPVVDIELRLGTGRARITLPREAIVDLEGLAGWKEARYRPPRRAGGAGPRIRISGAVGLGRVTIRHAWL
ncbi:DUF1707 SHOCT-like domain-containing protein [Nonomuraea typhae]|uniref:DUF1707 SHOCT-like domain-containing protein n=1 Tax=Nonomuraea typhae TaxID=2603600 RepID=UPI0012FA9373|nr:DUF1707 domain-containing protein [Nonomuraea typhae]